MSGGVQSSKESCYAWVPQLEDSLPLTRYTSAIDVFPYAGNLQATSSKL